MVSSARKPTRKATKSPSTRTHDVGTSASCDKRDTYPTGLLRLNVLIRVFDSTSRDGFARNLPKSWRFMREQMGGVLFRGHNVLGLNTLPNMLPFHFGVSDEEWFLTARSQYAEDIASSSGSLLRIHQKNGYVTCYAEDYIQGQGTFQGGDELQGFRDPPADHHTRTYWLSQRVASETMEQPFFVGNETTNSFNQKYIQGLWESYKDERKFFMSHESTYSHENDVMLTAIDGEVRDFLRWVSVPEIRNDTVVIVMSDHGNVRYSPLQFLFQGKMETKMPMLFIAFPRWMDSVYPRQMGNLRFNANERLVTNYDLRRTLLELLTLRSFNAGGHLDPKNSSIRGEHPPKFTRDPPADIPAKDLPLGVSLFERISKHRTCASAGIDRRSCACLSPRPVLREDFWIVEQCARKSTEIINEFVAGKLLGYARRSDKDAQPVPSLCRQWEVESIEGAWAFGAEGTQEESEAKTNFPSRGAGEEINSYFFSAMILASPGRTVFEVTFQLGDEVLDKNGSICELSLQDIVRRGRYGRLSHCVNHLPELRPWCYCRDGI